jgi:hypothetical protein
MRSIPLLTIPILASLTLISHGALAGDRPHPQIRKLGTLDQEFHGVSSVAMAVGWSRW